MPRFLTVSDLHGRHYDWLRFVAPLLADLAPLDGILVAGDFGERADHLDWAEEAHDRTGLPVVMVWGNHDVLARPYLDLLAWEKDRLAELHARGLPIHVLHGQSVTIGSTLIAGATLWTDFALYPGLDPTSRKIAARTMIEFVYGRTGGARDRRLSPEDTVPLHHAQKREIRNSLAARHRGPRIVISHHVPSARFIHPRFAGDALNPAFASDLETEILDWPFDLWLFGHTHSPFDETVEGQDGRPHRFLCNPFGYRGEHTGFDPVKIVELP